MLYTLQDNKNNMHHTEIANSLKTIIAEFMADPIHTEAPTTEELAETELLIIRKIELFSALISKLTDRILAAEAPSKGLAYLIIYLNDLPEIANIRHLTMMSQLELMKHPGAAEQVAKLRALPYRLYKFIRDCGRELHSELLSAAGVTVQDAWIDPLTSFVMNFPVSYIIGNTTYTIDLTSLLTYNEDNLSIFCPFTKQVIFVSDLIIRTDLRLNIINACKIVPTQKVGSIESELTNALKLIKSGDLSGFKKWTVNKSNQYFEETINSNGFNGSLFYHACKLKQFGIITFLLDTGLWRSSYYNRNNNSSAYDLPALQAALKTDPENLVLHFLLTLAYNEILSGVDLSEPSVALLNSDNIINLRNHMQYMNDKKYSPGMIIISISLFTQKTIPAMYEAVDILLDSISRGYPIALSTLLSHFFTLDPVPKFILLNGENSQPKLPLSVLMTYSLKVLQQDCLNIDRIAHSKTYVATFLDRYNETEGLIMESGYAWLIALCCDAYAHTDPKYKNPLINDVTGTQALCKRYEEEQQYFRSFHEKGVALGILKPWTPFKPFYT